MGSLAARSSTMIFRLAVFYAALCAAASDQETCRTCLRENAAFGKDAVRTWCSSSATCYSKSPVTGKWDAYDEAGRSLCRDGDDEPGKLITNPQFCDPRAKPVTLSVEARESTEAEVAKNWKKMGNVAMAVDAFKEAAAGKI